MPLVPYTVGGICNRFLVGKGEPSRFRRWQVELSDGSRVSWDEWVDDTDRQVPRDIEHVTKPEDMTLSDALLDGVVGEEAFTVGP